MKVINFAETNSVLNQYMAEIRDVQVQSDRIVSAGTSNASAKSWRTK